MLGKTNAVQPPSSAGNYTILTNELLGKGSTGSVYKGFHNFTKQPVAIKAVDLASIKDDATKSLLQNEKEGLKAVKAPNVLKLEDIVEDGKFCFIITELCEGTTLQGFIAEKKKVGENEAMAIFRKITAGALAVAHECMIHRDLKPANVMIDSRGEPKIIDFGYCEIIRAKKVMKTFNVGSPSYMSPEAYQRTLYSEKSDAWSLGVILYELLHGHPLDQGMDIKRYFEELKNDAHFVEKRISPSINLQVKEIIEKALKFSPQERPNISTLKYQSDLYHVNLRQKNTNVTNVGPIVQPMGVVVKQVPKIKFQGEVQSLKRVESQNKVVHHGFVSFKEFVEKDPKGEHHQMKVKHMTSLDDFDGGSRVSSSRSKGVAMDQKLSTFLQNTVKQQHKNIRPSSSNNLPAACRATMVSGKEISHYPPQPKLVRTVTVRYT